jgi:hypothetical protein
VNPQKIIYCRDIVPWFALHVGSSTFWCPYCERTWERGGHKEGFVKAGAQRHVHSCWEILLFQRGYTIGEYRSRGGQMATPLAKLDGSEPWHKSWIRSIKASIARRRREGFVPKMPRRARRG